MVILCTKYCRYTDCVAEFSRYGAAELGKKGEFFILFLMEMQWETVAVHAAPARRFAKTSNKLVGKGSADLGQLVPLGTWWETPPADWKKRPPWSSSPFSTIGYRNGKCYHFGASLNSWQAPRYLIIIVWLYSKTRFSQFDREGKTRNAPCWSSLREN